MEQRVVHIDNFKDQTPETETKKNEALDGYHSKVIKSIMSKYILYTTYKDKNIDVCLKNEFYLNLAEDF